MARKKVSPVTPEESREMLGSKLNFAAAEAYKLLRTNLTFSLADETGCKVIGITSALREEGKSTTSINLAYTIAETGKDVLLLECDLRLPSISKRLNLNARPGISNLLAGQCSGGDVLQKSGLHDSMTVITAGDIPPNPAELLGSEQMATMVRELAKTFDVIVIDLPPVTAVSDALIMSRLLSGMIVVVRQDYCGRDELDEVVRQLRFAEAKILGFVVTDADTQQKNYKRYKKYKKYGYYEDYEKKPEGAASLKK